MNDRREYVTIAIWTALALTAYAAGRMDSIVLAPLMTLLGFVATWRMLNT